MPKEKKKNWPGGLVFRLSTAYNDSAHPGERDNGNSSRSAGGPDHGGSGKPATQGHSRLVKLCVRGVDSRQPLPYNLSAQSGETTMPQVAKHPRVDEPYVGRINELLARPMGTLTMDELRELIADVDSNERQLQMWEDDADWKLYRKSRKAVRSLR